MMKRFNVIVAATSSAQGIGKDGLMPWQLKEDLAYFKSVTTKNKNTHIGENIVIMVQWQHYTDLFQ